MLKVMTIVGTRPELIKMSRVICEFDKSTNHILVHTGQNYDYELNEIFFEDLQIRRPDYFLEVKADSVAASIGQIIEKSDEVFEKECPDALLLYGDTNSCLSVLAAKRRKIPVFHLEAGNRCFDQRVPEELNRKVLDHLSDINLVLSENARHYLIAEGVRPETVIKTGSNMREVLNFHAEKINNSPILDKLKLQSSKYFIVSIHREENVDTEANLRELLSTLGKIEREYSLPIIVSTHPRTKKRIKELGADNLSKNIKFLKPFSFSDYIKLQIEAKCVLSDSGTITEEASMLNLPAVTVRNTHERPEGMDAGTLIMSGLKSDRVLESIKTVCSHHSQAGEYRPIVRDYENTFASKQILRLVLSYTDYVNRTVWVK